MTGSGLFCSVLLYLFVSAVALLLLPFQLWLMNWRPLVSLSSARAFALLSIGGLSFLCGHGGVSLKPGTLAFVALFLLTGLSLSLLIINRKRIHNLLSRNIRALFLLEAVSALAFAAMILLRSLQPDIYGAEKFWDFALLNGVLEAPSFPVEDPWMAGEHVNYYYLGHAIAAWPLCLTGIRPEVGYNLCLALWFSLATAGSLGLGWAATGKKAGGVLCAVLVTVMGSLYAPIQIVLSGRLLPFDYWPSSRIIPGTINEFPFFSFLHGDLHPHLLNVPFVLLSLAFMSTQTFPSGEQVGGLRFMRFPVGALLLGGCFAVNAWDLTGFLLLSVFLTLPVSGERTGRILRLPGMIILAVLLYVPFYREIKNPFYGIGVVERGEGSPLWGILVEFGLLLVPPALVALTIGVRRSRFVLTAFLLVMVVGGFFGYPSGFLTAGLGGLLLVHSYSAPLERRQVFFVRLAAAGLLLLSMPEVCYLRDAFTGELRRMNTVFKLHYEAWLFLAVSCPALMQLTRVSLRDLFQGGMVRLKGPTHWLRAVVATLILLQLVYPLATTATRMARHDGSLTLDGWRYLKEGHGDESEAIRFLRENRSGLERLVSGSPGKPARLVLLEFAGEPYTYSARVCSNTGIPSVIGWENHESVWRKSAGTRRDDVESMFSAKEFETFQRLGMEKYGVNLVFIGELERERYPAECFDKFGEGELVYERGQVKVYAFPYEVR